MRSRQYGKTVVEFAFVASILFLSLIGIMEVSRVMFTWNAANEATRYGSRVAVVCTVDTTKALVTARIQKFVPSVTSANVVVEYLPSTTAVELVRVSLTGLNIDTFIPFFNYVFPVPRSRASLPTESMVGTASTSVLCDPSQ